MKPSDGLNLALTIAQQQREQAGQMLAQVLRAQLHAQRQMDQLQSYAQETEMRWTRQAQQNATPEWMRHHYQFMERLYHAIHLQQQTLEQCARHVHDARQGLLAIDVRIMRLSKVIAGRERELRAQAERSEQKTMDQLAAVTHRLHQQRSSGAGDWV